MPNVISPKIILRRAPATLKVGRYKCSATGCSKQYVRVLEFKKHCEKQHPGCKQLEDIEAEVRLMMECSECGAKFASTGGRLKHWKKKHMKTKRVGDETLEELSVRKSVRIKKGSRYSKYKQ